MTERSWVALLRGINVGGHRVKMDRLRAVLGELGLGDVSTYIASGNALFTSDAEDRGALAAHIERGLHAALGYEVATFLRTPAELREVAAFDEAATTTSVVFLKEPPGPELRSRFEAARSDVDDFSFGEREIYWLIDVKMSESPLFRGFTRLTRGVENTMRNLTTVQKLAAKLPRVG